VHGGRDFVRPPHGSELEWVSRVGGSWEKCAKKQISFGPNRC
jgi:hypothetical protein